jgi:predicted glycosyltransferase
MKVFFYVQNLLGIGHIVRAMRIAAAIDAAGGRTTLVLGGVPVENLPSGNLSIVQLTPIRAGDSGFTELVSVDGQPIDAAFKARRRDELLDVYGATHPDVVLIEAYPFGRRQMRFEITPLLEAVRARTSRPLVVSSIRDILQINRKPGRDAETVDVLRAHFDHVIVHGDPTLAPLDASFALAADIADLTSYSGLVAPGQPAPGGFASHDVIVSAGGGAVGAAVLKAALEARPLTRAANWRWLAIVGPNMPASDSQSIMDLAAAQGVDCVQFVPDLVDRLAMGRLSISQAGYNTVADLLVARCRAVLVPFVAAGETEQTLRAQKLEDRELAVLVSEQSLTATSMASAIDRAIGLPEPARQTVQLDGAARTAEILRRLLSSERER